MRLRREIGRRIDRQFLAGEAGLRSITDGDRVFGSCAAGAPNLDVADAQLDVFVEQEADIGVGRRGRLGGEALGRRRDDVGRQVGLARTGRVERRPDVDVAVVGVVEMPGGDRHPVVAVGRDLVAGLPRIGIAAQTRPGVRPGDKAFADEIAARVEALAEGPVGTRDAPLDDPAAIGQGDDVGARVVGLSLVADARVVREQVAARVEPRDVDSRPEAGCVISRDEAASGEFGDRNVLERIPRERIRAVGLVAEVELVTERRAIGRVQAAVGQWACCAGVPVGGDVGRGTCRWRSL